MSIETNLIAGTASNNPTTVYTSSGDSAITSMFFCNTDSTDIDITVYIVPNGDTLGDQHTIMKELTVNATDTFAFGSERILLGAGDTVKAFASTTNKISVVISYTGI